MLYAVNDTLKVPLQPREIANGSTNAHRYLMNAEIPFRTVTTMKLVTGNALLDSTLRQVTFRRKSRIKDELVGPGY